MMCNEVCAVSNEAVYRFPPHVTAIYWVQQTGNRDNTTGKTARQGVITLEVVCQHPLFKMTLIQSEFISDHSQIKSATEGGRVWKMLTLTNKEGEGGSSKF